MSDHECSNWKHDQECEHTAGGAEVNNLDKDPLLHRVIHRAGGHRDRTDSLATKIEATAIYSDARASTCNLLTLRSKVCENSFRTEAPK